MKKLAVKSQSKDINTGKAYFIHMIKREDIGENIRFVVLLAALPLLFGVASLILILWLPKYSEAVATALIALLLMMTIVVQGIVGFINTNKRNGNVAGGAFVTAAVAVVGGLFAKAIGIIALLLIMLLSGWNFVEGGGPMDVFVPALGTGLVLGLLTAGVLFDAVLGFVFGTIGGVASKFKLPA